MTKVFAGVGSRKAPLDILEQMTKIGAYLAKNGWTLRSGAADGSDAAFERGCDEALGNKEIYLPYKNFNHHPSPLYKPSKQAFEIAKTIHPWWGQLTYGGMCLHARNCHQVLGINLDDPVEMVICWTDPKAKYGGTKTAIKLAAKYNIPTYNLAVEPIIIEELI